MPHLRASTLFIASLCSSDMHLPTSCVQRYLLSRATSAEWLWRRISLSFSRPWLPVWLHKILLEKLLLCCLEIVGSPIAPGPRRPPSQLLGWSAYHREHVLPLDSVQFFTTLLWWPQWLSWGLDLSCLHILPPISNGVQVGKLCSRDFCSGSDGVESNKTR